MIATSFSVLWAQNIFEHLLSGKGNKKTPQTLTTPSPLPAPRVGPYGAAAFHSPDGPPRAPGTGTSHGSATSASARLLAGHVAVIEWQDDGPLESAVSW